MDRVAFAQRAAELIKKYRYVLLVLAVGIVLMLLPSGQVETEDPVIPETVSAKKDWDLTEELTQILMQVKGAGEVKVLLTVAGGYTTVYQYDTDTSGRHETVIVTDANRNQSGLVQQINPPKYQGAIIVCQGADNDVVRLHIIEAVAKVTGLGTDKISVLKMK